MCVYIYVCMYIYIYICNHENNVPSCTSCAQVHELPQSYCGDNQEERLHIYHAYLASVRFEHAMCRGSLMTPYNI